MADTHLAMGHGERWGADLIIVIITRTAGSYEVLSWEMTRQADRLTRW